MMKDKQARLNQSRKEGGNENERENVEVVESPEKTAMRKKRKNKRKKTWGVR